MGSYKGHTYEVEIDYPFSAVNLFFSETGKMYTELIDNDFDEYELLDVLYSLIARGEKDRDIENEKNVDF